MIAGQSVWRHIAPIVIVSLVVVAMLGMALVIGADMALNSTPFTLTAFTLLFLIGIVAGILGGLIGVGGSTIMLPIMYFYLGFPETIAVGTGLFVVIFTSISGASGHLMRRNLDLRVSAWIAAGGLIGVLIGSWLFTLLAGHTHILGLILGLIFLAPSISMIREGLWPGADPEPEQIGGRPPEYLFFGTGVGVLTGVTGLGGGYALVPGLIYLFGAPIHITMGTSLASMIPMAIVGGGIKLSGGYVAVGAGLVLAAGSIAGAQIGAATIRKFRPEVLKVIFGLYFLYAATRFIAEFFGIGLV